MDAFLWLKALHVISIIAWMAGLLYLPRLFVYHAMQTSGSDAGDTLKLMELRLLKVIMNPALIASWVFGLIIATQSYAFSQPWFHVKLLMVVALTAFHIMLGKWRKQFEIDQNEKSEQFFRLVNEVPTVLMIIIVILVIVKPF
ncbi:MAG: protoporphyrinogen oxidase HemJ [bacterium]|nr:protoporphyrinogen oxidase HemJ [bacterium]